MAGTTSWKKPSLEILHWLRPGKQTRLETLFSGKVRRNTGLNHAENVVFFKKSRQIYQFHLETELLSASKHGCVLPSLPVFPQQSADLGACDAIDSWIVFETVHYQTLHKTLRLFTHNHQHISEHSLDLSTPTVQMHSSSGRSFPPNCWCWCVKVWPQEGSVGRSNNCYKAFTLYPLH